MKKCNNPLGEQLAKEFSELRDALRKGKPLNDIYTVKTVKKHMKKAFTLVELLVVIGIIALFITMCLPHIHAVKQANGKETVPHQRETVPVKPER